MSIKKKCEFCNIKFKNLVGHQRFCKAKKEASQAVQTVASSWNPLADERNKLKADNERLDRIVHKQRQVLNGYRETLGAAGRLLASLVDVSEIN